MTYDLRKLDYEKEHIYVVEIDLSFCTLTYGVGACQAGEHQVVTDTITVDDFAVDATITGNTTGATGTITAISGSAPTYTFTYTKTNGIDFDDGETITASGGSSGIATLNGDSVVITDGDDKCFNTLQTCQDIDNYDESDNTYRFCSKRSPHPEGLDAIPCIENITMSPAVLDTEGGLGIRSSSNITFTDLPHDDNQFGLDKYLSERTYNALERGSFWTKLRARNPNYQFRNLRILSGFLVNNAYDPVNFQTRHYVINKLDVGRGRATLTGKDPLKLASSKKAQAPRPSIGKIDNIGGISAAATSLTLDITGSEANSEYGTSGKIRINKEVISYTRTLGSNVMSLTRAQNNTVAAAHAQNDTVQECLVYDGVQIYEVDEDLLVNYANVDPSFIPTAAWEAEDDTFLGGFIGETVITTPTDVFKLLKETAQSVGHYLWWDERSQEIQFTAIKPPPGSANSLTMNANIIEDSFDPRDMPDMRVNTVFIHYGQFDPTRKLDETENYQQTYARIDQDNIDKFKSNQVKTIFSRWIVTNNSAQARKTAALIGRRFAEIPREVSFRMEVKDSDTWAGQNKIINHRDIVDDTGLPVDTIFQITSVAESSPGIFSYRGLEYIYGGELPEDEGGGDPGVDLVILDSSQRNINLRTIYDGLFPTPDGSTQAKFIVDNGVTIGAVGGTAIDTGSWPVGAVITLQTNSGAFVVGFGGSAQPSSNGSAGGDAIILNHDLTLINNGVIGGGGGGGGSASDTAGGVTAFAGGGGGAGDLLGLGQPSTVNPGPGLTINGSAGTLETGGAGGYAVGGTPEAEATAGAGGDLGQAGADATEGFTQYNGGAAGNAIDKNGYTLTETVTGDIRGAIIA